MGQISAEQWVGFTLLATAVVSEMPNCVGFNLSQFSIRGILCEMVEYLNYFVFSFHGFNCAEQNPMSVHLQRLGGRLQSKSGVQR